MVDKKNNTQRENPKKQVINEKTILDDDKSKKSIVGWILVALLIVFIIVLTFLFRKDTFLESAKKYVADNDDIEINDQLIIEAQDLEDEGYETGLGDKCIKESYILVTKDKDGNLKYESKKICDDVEPTIELIGDDKITININGEYKELGAKAEIGSKDISDRITIDSKALDTTKVGTYEIKYTIKDRYGNTASVVRSVEVLDNVPPVITLYGGYSVSVYLGQTFNDPGYIAKDNVDGDITKDVEVTGEVDVSRVGNYTLTYMVEDKAGNETTVTRKVNILPIPSPTLVLRGSNLVYHPVGKAFNEPGFFANDPIKGNISKNVTVSGKVDVNKLGTYTLTYTVTGTNGTKTVTRTVIVVDNIAPVIKLPVSAKEVEIYEGDDFSYLLTATVTDNFDTSPKLTITNNVNNKVSGTYSITYTATDASGNKAVAVITVRVLSKSDAKITLKGLAEMTYIVGTPGGFVDPGYTAIDLFNNEDITSKVVVSGDTVIETPGTYKIVYTVTGESGNAVTVTRTVIVKELVSISITTPASKLAYVSGEVLDITGLVVTAVYSDGSTEPVTITVSDITGFDSSIPVAAQTLTITYMGKTATYDIEIEVFVGDQTAVQRPNIGDGDDYVAAYTAAGVVVSSSGNTTTFSTPSDMTSSTVADILRLGGNPASTVAYVGIVFDTPSISSIAKVDVNINSGGFTGTPLDLSGPNGANLINNKYILYFRFADETTPGVWTPAAATTYNLVFKWYDASDNLIAETSTTVLRAQH